MAPEEDGGKDRDSMLHFHARYSDHPGAGHRSPFEEVLIDVSAYATMTVEVSSSEDLQTWEPLPARPAEDAETGADGSSPPPPGDIEGGGRSA